MGPCCSNNEDDVKPNMLPFTSQKDRTIGIKTSKEKHEIESEVDLGDIDMDILCSSVGLVQAELHYGRLVEKTWVHLNRCNSDMLDKQDAIEFLRITMSKLTEQSPSRKKLEQLYAQLDEEKSG